MTAKRFTFDEDVNEDYMYEMGVFSDNGELMETTDVLNCLNELHEENQELKRLVKATVEDYTDLKQSFDLIDKENEQLKQSQSSTLREFEKGVKKVQKLARENEQLKHRVDELEDDNMKYTLSTDKLEEYSKRFIPTKCINEFRDCKTNRYYWLDNEDNFTGALELLNLLDCENEQLKSELGNCKECLELNRESCARHMNENEQLKSFIDDLTTKGTGRIDLANGYSYRVSAVLTNWKGDVE